MNRPTELTDPPQSTHRCNGIDLSESNIYRELDSVRLVAAKALFLKSTKCAIQRGRWKEEAEIPKKKQSISDLWSEKPTSHAWEHTSPHYLFWLCRCRQPTHLPALLSLFHSERTRILLKPTVKPQCWGHCPQGQSVGQTAAGKTALYSWLQSPSVISPSFFLTAWHQLRNQDNNDDNMGVR